MPDILSLLQERVDPSKIKRASSRNGGEYHSPCPLCGGEDRFIVFPDQEGGEVCQRHGITGTWSCPRGCGKGGDVIGFLMEVHGMTFMQACRDLKIEYERSHNYRPLRRPQSPSAPEFVPRSYAEPPDIWKVQATKLASEAHAALLQNRGIRTCLAGRGLPEEAVRAYRLGYLAEEGKNADCLYRARSAFGLPDKQGKNGPIRALWIPRGVTIPAIGQDGRVCRIRIRRRNADLKDPKDSKYMLIPQSSDPYSAPLCLPPQGVIPGMATWVIVESELDAMSVHHACGGAVGVLSVLTVSGKPDVVAHRHLRKAVRILLALDFDQDKEDGSNPGAGAWPWWERTYDQAGLWPVPEGKDPGEAFALGVDLRAWVSAGMPVGKLPDAGSGDAFADGQVGKAGEIDAGDEVAASGRRRCWRAAPAASLADVRFPPEVARHVSVHYLLKEFRGRVGREKPGDFLIPCPITKSPFWWKSVKDCSGCPGHPLCLMGFVESQIFQEALHAH